MPDELKLLPCPFCGGSVALFEAVGEEASIARWNTRPIEDALRAKLEAAEARCKSALKLYEDYHDANIDLRVENDKLKTRVEAAEEVIRKLEGIVFAADEFADHLFKTGVLSAQQAKQYENSRNECRVLQGKWRALK